MLPAECFGMLRQAAATRLEVQVGPATSSQHRGGGRRHGASRCLVGYFLPQDLHYAPVKWKNIHLTCDIFVLVTLQALTAAV